RVSDRLCVCIPTQRVVDRAALGLVAGNCALLRNNAAMVYRGAASKSDVLPGILSPAQPGAVCDQPVSASAAVLVLPCGCGAGSDAVDGDCWASVCRW